MFSYINKVFCSVKLSLAFIVLVSLFVESFIFNVGFFTFDSDLNKRTEINLPYNDAIAKRGVVLTPEKSSISLNDLNIEAETLYIEGWFPSSRYISGNVTIRDDASTVYAYPAATFSFDPKSDLNYDLVRFEVRGKLHSLSINLDKQWLRGGIVLTKIVLNERPFFDFSFVRCFALILILSAIYAVFRFKLYEKEYDSSNKYMRYGNYGVLAFCLFSCFAFFSLISPHNTNVAGFDVLGEGYIPITTEEHSLLLDLPKTKEEITNSDAYTQLLHAFTKGQLNIDLYVDPLMTTMSNPYDRGVREQYKELRYTWDRPFYNGKYFVYWGLSPLLTVYLPIYFLTGMAPSLALAATLLGSLGIIAMFLALNSMYRYFRPKVNMLIFYGAEISAILSTNVLMHVVYPRHYDMPYLGTLLWLSVAVACAFSAVLAESRLKRNLLLILCGIAVPMVVMSRPLVLLFAISITGPVLLYYFWKNLKNTARIIENACALFIPVVIGAICIMVYNYMRFDSIFEFGVNYQVTVYDTAKFEHDFYLAHFKNVLYYYVFEPLTYTKNFPFVGLGFDTYLDNGNFVFLAQRLSLFSLPFFWALFLGVILCSCKEVQECTNRSHLIMQRIIVGTSVFFALFVAFYNYSIAGVSYSYTGDILKPLAFIAFILLITFVTYKRERPSKIFFALVMFLIAKTIVIDLLLPLSNFNQDMTYVLNPDAMVYLSRLLDPLTF